MSKGNAPNEPVIYLLAVWETRYMKTSDKILLGIYNHWPRLNDSILFETSELIWLMHHGPSDWRQDNGWKKIKYSADKGPNDQEVGSYWLTHYPGK